MKRVLQYLARNRKRLAICGGICIAVGLLLWFRLGTLTAGLSPKELEVANTPLGWHGIYEHPFFLPLIFIRSIVFFVNSDFGAFLLRVPNTLFGAAAIASYSYLIYKWHGARTAILATSLFATGAWLLHISRLASFDVMYLCAIPLLLASGLLLNKSAHTAKAYYGSALLWGSLLYTPGLIWLVALAIFWQRGSIAKGWKHFKKLWQRALYVFCGLIWLPLLVVHLLRPGQLALWLGAPHDFAAPLTMLKDFIGVFVHLFIRGPQSAETWLGRIPILDILTLALCIIGIYFYAQHRSAVRSRQLFSYFVVGVVLVALHGAVSISLLVPLLYVTAATGVAYLLRDWLKVFPNNPFARNTGIALLCFAVVLSCAYNLRAYFVAWPHNTITQATFRYHR